MGTEAWQGKRRWAWKGDGESGENASDKVPTEHEPEDVGECEGEFCGDERGERLNQ